MYNKKLKSNLCKIVFMAVFLSIAVFLAGSRVNKFLDNARYDSIESELNTKTEAYKIQVKKQLEADTQILYTVSGFLSIKNFDDLSILENILHESNKKNHFIGMLAIYENGQGIESIINQEEPKHINIDSMDTEIQRIYKEALNGDRVISDVFYLDYILGGNVVAIAVPIYSEYEKNIEGVLIAYDTVDQFNISLTTSIKSDGKLDYVNMIESNGNFIVRSINKLDEKDSTSIYNMGVSLLNEDEVKSALSSGKDYYSLFTLDGVQYGVYFKHLDYKDWYIYLINQTEVKSDYMIKISYITRIIFLFIIGIILFFSMLAYFILKKNNKILTELAYYDDLTGAYNLNHFRNICEYILKTKQEYSIVILNIKKFKFINEVFGEKGANELLCYIKEILEKNTHEGEYYGRDTADQFIIFIKSINKDEILERINKIKKEIEQFSSIKNQNCSIEIYGGICTYIKEENTVLSYKTMYDNALFSMKQFRKSNEDFIFYDEYIYKYLHKQSFIERYKQQALDNNEFKLFLQPKIDLKTKKITSAEALVRWIRDDGTIIYPNDFIPIFEKNGFCEKLDIYMIEEACKKLKEWMEIGINNISISVNQSKLSFYKSDYLESICYITKKYEIPNSLITLEILEGLTIHNFEQFNTTIEELHSKGFKVSMDDFGSGYSSFNTLSKLKIDELKIDKDFLLKTKKNDENEERQQIILKSIISLAEKLNIKTVVEGVENKEHLDFISELGCDMAQGYYFSKPLLVKDFEDKYINR